MNIKTKDTKYSLYDIDNYKKELDSSYVNLIVTISSLVTEYLNFIFENITIKNTKYAKFVIIRGLDTVLHVFRFLILYTKNIDLTYYHCQKSFYYYVEFVGQILEDDKTFLQLTSRDATIYVYKKILYDINNETKKKCITSNECNHRLMLMDSYISILYIYVYKILENPNFLLEKQDFLYIINKTIHQFHKIDSPHKFILNTENMNHVKKIIESLDFIISDTNDFFEINNILLKKIENTPNIINSIYIKLDKDYSKISDKDKTKIIKDTLNLL